ncbi:MAG: DUF58 domain-containing protein [Planctomycetota bacterium]|nr:DUF58 domain-containing protein [Planctomycetota bacterium]
MRHDPEIQRVVNSYSLGLPRSPISGRAGELLGRGTGSSLEFQEYREYQPGDDIRYLDWSAYARSDALMVRLYRDEISPRTQVLLDTSRSMATGSGAKSLLARQLAAMFMLLAGNLGAKPKLLKLDEPPITEVGIEGLELLTDADFAGRSQLDSLILGGCVPLARQSVRIVISDFLFPHDPDALIRRLSADASALWLIQVLTDWEAAPNFVGGRLLVDVETSHAADLVIDAAAIKTYRERLARLQDGLMLNSRRAHAVFVPVVAEHGLADVCRESLCRAEILRHRVGS